MILALKKRTTFKSILTHRCCVDVATLFGKMYDLGGHDGKIFLKNVDVHDQDVIKNYLNWRHKTIEIRAVKFGVIYTLLLLFSCT